MSEEKVTPCIEVGAPLFRKLENGDVINVIIQTEQSACCEGSQPWGCGAGQIPTCTSTEEIEKLRKEANEPE